MCGAKGELEKEKARAEKEREAEIRSGPFPGAMHCQPLLGLLGSIGARCISEQF